MHKMNEEYKPFDFNTYQEEINSEEFKKQQLKRLSDNARLVKALEWENISILSSFSSDPEKKRKLQDTVSQVYTGVLESNTEEHTIEDIVGFSLDKEDSDFLHNNRNYQHFNSTEVFEEHLEHPVQKILTKTGHLGKRQINKQKTPMQTLNYVYSAKSSSDRDNRLKDIEKSLAEAHHMISLLAVNQIGMTTQLDQHNKEFKEVKDRLSVVEDKIKDHRKLKLYALYTSNKKTTNKDLSIEIGVSVRTIKYWLKELRSLGVLSS